MSRRSEILDVALRLARSEGIGALSVRRVAAEAGVGASTLRHYFATQDDLRVAVATVATSAEFEDADIADPTRPPTDRLLDRLEQLLLADEASRNAFTTWFRAGSGVVTGSSTPETFKPLVAGAYSTATSAITRWLGVLADEGHLDRRDVDHMTATLLTFLDGLALRALLDVDDLDAARGNLRWLVEQLLAAARPTPARLS